MDAHIFAYEPQSVRPAYMVCYPIESQELQESEITDANRHQYRHGTFRTQGDLIGFSRFLEREVLGQPITPKDGEPDVIDGLVNGLSDLDPNKCSGVVEAQAHLDYPILEIEYCRALDLGELSLLGPEVNSAIH